MRPILSVSSKLVTVSSAALATALLSHAPAAQAQSFQGNPTAVFGTVDVNIGPGVTTIDVNSNSAVINWLPTDNPAPGQPHNFQPVGTTATFTGTSGSGANFSVLNRIIPTDPSRPIQFNGTVISNLQISSATDPGGNIFFYSPGGIILGSTANFDVGALALTTLDLEYDSAGNFDTGGAYVFNPLGSSTTLPLVPGSEVRINAGATIDTTLGGSYVALVAPRVTNNGAITMGLSGSAALVAADSATISFSPSGLFDIQVASGTSAAGAVVSNGGSITGPAAGVNDHNRVYMVAVAKNDAITMAIGSGSTLGFAIAGAANVSGNAVILSGGYDVIGGNIGAAPSGGNGAGQVSVTGGDADITSSFYAKANGGVNLGSNSAAGLNFAWDARLVGTGASSSLFANAGGSVTVAADATITGDSFSATGSSLGNAVSLLASAGGTIGITGNLSLNSVGQGADLQSPAGPSGAGFGGSATIEAANGGQITVMGNAVLAVNGIGGSLGIFDGTGGAGIGGEARIVASGMTSSSILISGNASLIADGAGGGGNGFCSTCTQFGGSGAGGIAAIEATGTHSIFVVGSTTAQAVGLGGGATGNLTLAGEGLGGEGYITGSLGAELTLHGTTVTVDGNGGSVLGAGQAGEGRGGFIEVSTLAAGATKAQFNGTLALAADGRGGQAPSGGSGGGALGGTILTSARDGSTITVTGDFSQVASGLAGNGFRGSSTGIGGAATLQADTGGTVNVVGNTAFFTIAVGGNVVQSEGSSTSVGGLSEISLLNGGTIDLGAQTTLNAYALGSDVSLSGPAGAAQGGTATITGLAGSIFSTDGFVELNALAEGGATNGSPNSNIQGGNAIGGEASVAFTGGLATIGTNLTINAYGLGGTGDEFNASGLGGSGTGGTARITAGTASVLGNGASITVIGQTNIDVNGVGEDGFNGGAGIGGQAFVYARNGNLALSNVNINARGEGSDGTSPGVGGIATGGTIEVVALSAVEGPSQIVTADLFASASSDAGDADDPDISNTVGGNGAFAQGGSVLVAGSAGNGILQTGDVSLRAHAVGGFGGVGNDAPGGNGGDALAGSVMIGVVSGIDTGQIDLGFATFGNVTARASGTGGDGGFGSNLVAAAGGSNGGNGTGGSAQVLVEGGLVTINGLTELQANALGGKVLLNGLGGSAQGGTASITGTAGGTFSAGGDVELSVYGEGGGTLASPNSNIQGGNAIGGDASVAFTGALATIGNLTMTAYGLGGIGDELNAAGLGGSGTGGTATITAGTPSALGNGASITVIGQTNIDVIGYGEDGLNGGAGIGGQAFLYARQGNLAFGNVSINARGEGSDGTSPGVGGIATGGTIEVVALSAVEGPSQIVTGDLFASASSDAGDADDPDSPGTIGGNGAFAQGGSVLVAGSAGNGILQTGDVSLRAHATGGFGGVGNDASGGNGGDAAAGLVRIGLLSGIDTGSINLGSATFGSITARANGTGGDGGPGSISVAGAVGGNGGNAFGGGARLIVEGGSVTINGTASWEANASGGNGGSGDTTGNGGNAVIGNANALAIGGSSAVVTSRSGQPLQLGSLIAGDLVFASSASEGNGLIDGTQTRLGSAAQFIIKDSAVDAANISLFSLANDAPNLAIVDPISLSNSTVTVSGLFQLNSSTSTSLRLDQSTLTAGIVAIGAANWVLDPMVPASLGTLTGTTALTLTSGQDLVGHANLATQSGLELGALGRIDFGSIEAGGLFDALAGTTLSLDDVSAQAVSLSAAGLIDVGSITANHEITAQSLGNINTGNLAAGTGVPTGSNGNLNSIGLRADGSITTGTIFAGSNLGIVATGAISTGDATAYDMLLLGDTSVSTGGLNASNRVLIANAVMEAAGGPRDAFDLNLVFAATPVVPTGGPITISGPVLATSFSAATQGAFTSGAITVVPSTTGSGNLVVNAGGALTAADLTASNALALSAGGAVFTGALVSDLQGVSVNTLNGSIATGAITATNDVSLGATQALTVNGNIAARSVFGTSGANLAFGEIGATGAISLSALGTMDVARANAARDIRLTSVGNLVTGDLSAGSGTPTAANGNLNSINLRSGANITSSVLFAGSNLNVFASGNISTQQATAYDMLLLGGGSVSTASLNASNRVLIANRSMETIGQQANGFNANLVFAAPVVATTGAISAGAVSATEFTAATQADFTSQSITVLPSNTGSGNLLVTAGGALNAANLVAFNRLNLVAGGALSTAALRSDTQGVKVAALGGSATTGAITARGDVLVSTPQALSVTGPINARDVLLLAGGNVSTGTVIAGAPPANAANPAPTSNPTGRVLIASNSLATESFLRSASVDYTALLAASPVRTGGTVNVGAVSAGRFISYSQGAMTGAAITTSVALDVESGGQVNIAQRWISPLATIASADIRIIDNGSLTDAAGRPVLSGLHSTDTGIIRIVSINGGQTLIGDGLTGTGYALSAAEFGLISSGNLSIGASNSTPSSASMQIGNLALTAGGSIGQSIAAGPSGRILFVTGNRDTQTGGGSIRITGNVTGSGFAGSNVVSFSTGRFELDAATGSLSLTQTGTALGGTVEIEAANIHIASGAILDKLAANPFYAGHVNDLNGPAAVSRPEGVLRALGLDLFPTGTLYIQNTGTFLDPAGFFADFELTDVSPPITATPASIAVIVNGKWQTPDGIIGGIAARDLVVDTADDLDLYTPSSTINGCAFSAVTCTATQELDPTPAITGQIAIVSNNVLGNTPEFATEPDTPANSEAAQATEEAQEEAEAAAAAAITSESATSPIAPPPQMINSAPLEQKPLIDQPVAGSGNPSLIGSAVNENSAEGTAQ